MRERRTHGSVRGLRREPLVYSTQGTDIRTPDPTVDRKGKYRIIPFTCRAVPVYRAKDFFFFLCAECSVCLFMRGIPWFQGGQEIIGNKPLFRKEKIKMPHGRSRSFQPCRPALF